jgi:hypothetical protein
LRREPFAIDIVFKYFRHNYSPLLDWLASSTKGDN